MTDPPSVSSAAQQIALTAKEKWQGMMTSLKGLSFEDGRSTLTKLRTNVDELEGVVKTMFGSCTTGETGAGMAPYPQSISAVLSVCHEDEPMSPSRKKEEFFYAQFLATDHARAAKAVHSLREHGGSTRPGTPAPTAAIPKPFPVSSPSKSKDNGVLVKEIVPPIHHAETKLGQQTALGGAISFDDGISAISAHTLEEMARTQHPDIGLTRSDLTSEGFETIDSSFEDLCHSSLLIKRNLSHSSSKRTRSTESTETMDFENAWRQDEQRYWEDVVENDVVRPKRTLPRCRSRESDHLKQNQTITTAGSSHYSSISSPFSRHPHDIFPHDPRDVVREETDEEFLRVVHIAKSSLSTDPDRLQDILVLEHETELGEI